MIKKIQDIFFPHDPVEHRYGNIIKISGRLSRDLFKEINSGEIVRHDNREFSVSYVGSTIKDQYGRLSSDVSITRNLTHSNEYFDNENARLAYIRKGEEAGQRKKQRLELIAKRKGELENQKKEEERQKQQKELENKFNTSIGSLEL